MSLTLASPTITDADLEQLLSEGSVGEYVAPEVMSTEGRNEDQAEWVLAGVIIAAAAIIVGCAFAWAAYVCSVCGARSLNACVNDLHSWWGAGC